VGRYHESTLKRRRQPLHQQLELLIALALSSAKMSLAPPAYISSLQNNIRARPISWEGAVRARTITDADLKKIKSIDKVRKEQRKQTIEGDVNGFVTLFLGNGDVHGMFQAAAKREDIIQYLLVLIGDLMDGVSNLATSPQSLSTLTD